MGSECPPLTASPLEALPATVTPSLHFDKSILQRPTSQFLPSLNPTTLRSLKAAWSLVDTVIAFVLARFSARSLRRLYTGFLHKTPPFLGVKPFLMLFPLLNCILNVQISVLNQNKMLENLVILNVHGRTASTSKHHLLCQVHSLIREHKFLIRLQQK